MQKSKIKVTNQNLIIFIAIFFVSLVGTVIITYIYAIKDKNMAPQNEIKEKSILMVVSPIDFRDEEYFEPKAVLESAGIQVLTASIQGQTAKSTAGQEINLDLTVSDADAARFDGVVFVGGTGMSQITGDESLQVLAQKFNSAGKLTAAICVAPEILAKGGLLAGKNATCWEGAKAELEKGGAVCQGNSVVADGNIITGSGPEAAKEFGEKIVEFLK